MNTMKKLFAAVLIAMLVVLPMTAFASQTPTGSESVYPKNLQDATNEGATLMDEEFLTPQNPSVVNPITATDYLTEEEPKPVETAPAAPAAPAVPETGVFAAVAASAALLAMGLATAKKN